MARTTVRARLTTHLRSRLRALRAARTPVLQMSVAAGISWVIAHDLLGHSNSYFAPVASTIVLSIVPGVRVRRAFELVLGIAVGIGVADAMVQVIGGGAWQISLVVLLAVSTAIMLGGGSLIASQAAGTAILVTAFPSTNHAPARFVDALVGGLVGLLVLVAVPRNTQHALDRVVHPLLSELSAVLDDVVGALAAADAGAADAALTRANAVAHLGGQFELLVAQARETALLAPAQWAALHDVERYEQASRHINYALRNVRVLANACRAALEQGVAAPAELISALRDLRAAVGALDDALSGRDDTAQRLVERSLSAASDASLALASDPPLAYTVVIALVQAVVVDLLRAIGVERREASARARLMEE